MKDCQPDEAIDWDSVGLGLRAMNDRFHNCNTARSQISEMVRSINMLQEICRNFPSAPDSIHALDELAFALEKLLAKATKSDSPLEAFIFRDTTSSNLRPGVELRAYVLLASEILYRNSTESLSRREADKEAASCFHQLGARGPDAVGKWRTANDAAVALELSDYRAIGERHGWFGKPLVQARTIVRDISKRAVSDLAAPRREPEQM